MLVPKQETWRKFVSRAQWPDLRWPNVRWPNVRWPRVQWPLLSWSRLSAGLSELAPKGLYARALIIIIAPIVLLESVVAFAFMERHWNQGTPRLSEATARDMAAIVSIYENSEDGTRLSELAQSKFGFTLEILPPGNLPTAQPQAVFDLLHRAMSDD